MTGGMEEFANRYKNEPEKFGNMMEDFKDSSWANKTGKRWEYVYF